MGKSLAQNIRIAWHLSFLWYWLFTCDSESRRTNSDMLVLDFKKGPLCNATTGRENNLSVLVCSLMPPRIFGDVKNWTMATLTAMSTASISFPNTSCPITLSVSSEGRDCGSSEGADSSRFDTAWVGTLSNWRACHRNKIALGIVASIWPEE